MNMKTAVKYQISGLKKTLGIYYLIICIIAIISVLSMNALNNNDNGNTSSFSGLDFSSIIFIFVVGLNSFKETFRMFLQNGRSRKTLFLSFVYSMVPICLIMALLDTAIGVIVNSLSVYKSAFIQIYAQRYAGSSSDIQMFFEGFLWYIFAYSFSAMAGYFITVLYYGMNKALKLLVSIGVPVLFLIILPIIEATYTNGVIFRGISNFFLFAFGFRNGINPFYSIITFALLFVLLGSLSYLLTKKATAKD